LHYSRHDNDGQANGWNCALNRGIVRRVACRVGLVRR